MVGGDWQKTTKHNWLGRLGESLVVAELGRRGIVATAFAGNVPDIDILAFANHNTLHMQVKAVRQSSAQFNATAYIDIEFNGDTQSVLGVKDELEAKLIFVFVKIGAEGDSDRFFVLEQKFLQNIICANYRAWLEKHNGVRPRNPKSTHVAVELSSLACFENNWQLIEQRLGLT